MSEKLKFVLSDKEVFDPYEGQIKKQKKSNQILIPSQFYNQDKIHTYGGKIEDPFIINTQNMGEFKDRVFTHKAHQGNQEKRTEAIK